VAAAHDCPCCLVQVLGDRSLKYKYVNPNTLFVATGTAVTGQLVGGPPTEQSVTATVLNTVTGSVLHQQVHHGCAGPVHAVASEHWVVYALRDVVNLRQQVRSGRGRGVDCHHTCGSPSAWRLGVPVCT